MVDTVKASIVRAVADQWPGITKIGGQRAPGDIAKSSRESEHTYGNALDIFGTFEAMGSLAEYLDDNRGRFDIATLCYDPGPGRKYDRCTTKHTDHIHVSFSPKCYDLPTDGDGATRAARCNDKQGTGDSMPDDTEQGFWGGFFSGAFSDAHKPGSGALVEGTSGTLLGPLVNTLNRIATTGLFVGVGVVLAGAGVYLAVKDTEAFKAIQGAAVSAATKGAA